MKISLNLGLRLGLKEKLELKKYKKRGLFSPTGTLLIGWWQFSLKNRPKRAESAPRLLYPKYKFYQS